MEEIKKKKKLNKKPLLICLAIALVFAVIGFIDIKSNAAESNTIDFNFIVWNVDENGNMFEKSNINEQIIGSDDIEVFYHQSHFEPVNNSDTYYQAFCVSKYPITHIKGNGSTYSGKEYSFNEQTFYVRQVSYNYTNTNGTGITGFVQGSFVYDNSKELNSEWLDTDEFAQLYAENNLDVKVDYNSFEIDDSISVVNNILRNEVVNNMKDSTLEIIVPDTYRYDYITWDNTSELELQIEVAPILQYYKGTLEKDYVKEYQGEWLKSDILASNTDSYLWLTRITSIEENYPDFSEWFYATRDKYYPDWNEILNFTYGYRIRYVDKDNLKAGKWVYIVPDRQYEKYKTYIEYLDSSLSNSADANGSQEVYENLENIDDALVDVDKENEFKDKYEIVDGDVDVQEATNWLYSVVNFVKGTPQVVGSVLGFLPQPILYGMYVCIFLGIIASGLAIVKALL